MSERTGKIQSVLGLVDPVELGHTQPHEHLLVNLLPKAMRDQPGEPIRLETLGWLRRNWTQNPENLRLTDQNEATEEIRLYKAAGGEAIVDVTCIGIARDPNKLVEISRETGVKVIMGSGYYTQAFHPSEIEDEAEDTIARRIVADVCDGVDGTDIKSGIIGEIGLDWPVTDGEAKVLRAAALAQTETGAAINIHPGRNTAAPMDAIRIVKEAGGNVERTAMSHIDRTIFSIEAMLELADTGCYLEFDLFGHESSHYPISPIDQPNDAVRIDYLMALIAKGYRDKLLISQDICTKIRLTIYGGEGYAHIRENIIPLMERKGMSDQDIKALTVDNPAHLLTFVQAGKACSNI